MSLERPTIEEMELIYLIVKKKLILLLISLSIVNVSFSQQKELLYSTSSFDEQSQLHSVDQYKISFQKDINTKKENVFSSKTHSTESIFGISLQVGICYLPLGEWSTSGWNSYPQRNKNEPSYSGTLSLSYLFDEIHSINFGVGITRAKATASDLSSNVSWTFTGYPINITYYYHLAELNPNLVPFLGIGLIYTISGVQVDIVGKQDRIVPAKLEETGFGVEGIFGMKINLSEKFILNPNLGIKYINGSAFAESHRSSIDFSGVYFLIGLIYEFK